MSHLIQVTVSEAEMAAFANVVAASRDKVCSVCELGQMGHAPESEWLGYEYHRFTPIPATPAMLERAGKLTVEAYRRRNDKAASTTGDGGLPNGRA